MRGFFFLSGTQFNRIKTYFSFSHRVAPVDDLRVISGIIYVIRMGCNGRMPPGNTGRTRHCITVYNCFVRWSRLGVFNRIFVELAGKEETPERLMIDATHLKAHRTAASLLKKGM